MPKNFCKQNIYMYTSKNDDLFPVYKMVPLMHVHFDNVHVKRNVFAGLSSL